jgi:NADH:ubiquinone oxidoreductase subunit 5 (subunit L)/multisubunit Na+/H+ antiporter MnhA subunit
LLLIGMFQRGWAQTPTWQYQVIAVLAVGGVVLGAWYMLYLVQRVFFGPLRQPRRDPAEPPVGDLSLREVCALAPLVVFIVWIGVQPQFFLQRMGPTLDELTASARNAADRQGTVERVESRKQPEGSGLGIEGSGFRDLPAGPAACVLAPTPGHPQSTGRERARVE